MKRNLYLLTICDGRWKRIGKEENRFTLYIFHCREWTCQRNFPIKCLFPKLCLPYVTCTVYTPPFAHPRVFLTRRRNVKQLYLQTFRACCFRPATLSTATWKNRCHQRTINHFPTKIEANFHMIEYFIFIFQMAGICRLVFHYFSDMSTPSQRVTLKTQGQ